MVFISHVILFRVLRYARASAGIGIGHRHEHAKRVLRGSMSSSPRNAVVAR